MRKFTAVNFVNKQLGQEVLKNSNTNFSNINSRRLVWWMNIKLDRLKEDFNILLVDKEELHWLKVQANHFNNPRAIFRVWEEKKAIDLYISADKNDRYFKDLSSGATEVDFKPLIHKSFSIPDYLELDNSIKTVSKRKNSKGHPIVNQISIENEQSNISYEKLFGDYLIGSTKITLQDPYIRYHHQFENLVEFCQLLEDVKKDGQYLHFELITWNSDEFKNNSLEYLHGLRDSLNESGIKFTYKFEDKHDRFIQTDTGWKIILGRGLDIFHKVNSKISLAHRDQTKRRCKECEVTYIRN